MKDPKSVGEEIHKFVEMLLVESASELQKAFIESVLMGTGIVIVGSRGSGKRPIQQIAYEELLSDSFKNLERRANLMVLDEVELKPYAPFPLTDYDPRGADRIKGPRGPRTKWGKIK